MKKTVYVFLIFIVFSLLFSVETVNVGEYEIFIEEETDSIATQSIVSDYKKIDMITYGEKSLMISNGLIKFDGNFYGIVASKNKISIKNDSLFVDDEKLSVLDNVRINGVIPIENQISNNVNIGSFSLIVYPFYNNSFMIIGEKDKVKYEYFICGPYGIEVSGSKLHINSEDYGILDDNSMIVIKDGQVSIMNK